MELSTILVWNVRGLNNKARRDVIRDLVATTKPEIVCFQETKVEEMTTRILLSTLGMAIDGHAALPATGTRGGMLIAWKSVTCRAITFRVDTFSVSVLFQNGDGAQ